jgi:NAD+ diphosphatase
MSNSFTDRLPLSRAAIDRDHTSRDDPTIFERDDVRFLVLRGRDALLTETGGLALVPAAGLDDVTLRVYLGRSTADERDVPVGTPLAAAVLAPSAEMPGRFAGLRSLVGALSDRDAGLFTEALAMLNWHASHGFSPLTGEPSVPAKAGWVRVGADGHEIFPRTDPAIIVGITDAADRLLLGSNAAWESNRYSLLAGFVEPGESLEEAVVREVFEEAGIRVTDPVYLGSQPWPFPASIMLGFRARLDPEGPALRPDGEEILDVRWFSREELAASAGEVLLPGAASIARAIIEDWFGGPLPDGL